MEKREKIFPDGIICKPKNNGAPDFVLCKMSFNVEQAIATLKTHSKKGWVNMDMLMSKEGKPYLEIDTWEPDPTKASAPKAAPEVVLEDAGEDLPF